MQTQKLLSMKNCPIGKSDTIDVLWKIVSAAPASFSFLFILCSSRVVYVLGEKGYCAEVGPMKILDYELNLKKSYR